MTAAVPADLSGSETVLEVGPVAHGGHCVGRWDGRVVFVRHTLPGETVRVRVTEGNDSSRFLRADAIEVLQAAPGRVAAPCPYAGPGLCGGCDWQHATPATQRDLLAAVVAEQLARLAGIEQEVVVEAVAPEDLGWRTRLGWTVDAQGRPGLHRHRSHEVVPVDRCRIAAEGLPDVHDRSWSAAHVDATVSSLGDTAVVAGGKVVQGRTRVRERVHEREFRVSAAGFWQVHPAAARTLVDAVLAYGRPAPGERVADLYAGVGLFSAFLGEAVGPDGSVLAVEGDAQAVKDARRNLHGLPKVRIEAGRVGDVLGRLPVQPLDLVVLDPPRVGARARVVAAVAARAPARVVYVACDPAALARDVATFGERGYRLSGLRAFALFPMTHHVECVALLTRN
ncbi:MAG: TRAM domain-containing protein [Actinomycetota bacterium]|nr:TRAM domain-containing protein [Actinomycetota bacterium]